MNEPTAAPAVDASLMPSPRFFFAASAASGVFFLVWTWLTMYQGSTQPFDDRCVDFWSEWMKENRGLTAMMIFWTDMGGIAANTLIAFLGAIWQSAIGNRIIAVAWIGIAI